MSKLKASHSNPPLDPSSDPEIVAVQETSLETTQIASIIDSFKDKCSLERPSHIRKKIEDNAQQLAGSSRDLYRLSTERINIEILGADGFVNLLLSKKQKDAIDLQNGIGTSGGNNNNSSQDDGYFPALLLGSHNAVKNVVFPVCPKLPTVEKLPPFTTWVFQHRNHRMDQSVVNLRRIYYESKGGEALICSDSDEEIIHEEEEQKGFAESEDYILRMTIEKAGLSDKVLGLLANCFSRNPNEVKARYEDLINKEETSNNENTEFTMNSFLDKDLVTAMDSFTTLFCRRCLVFDCQLHGCSQDLIFPANKQPPWSHPDANKEPCGIHCYLAVINQEGNSELEALQISKEEVSSDKHWKPLEKALFEKGLEIFGRSSCLIARNLLNGLRSCWEVFQYIDLLEGDETESSSRGFHRKGRALRRKVKVCRLKRTQKSGGRPSNWKQPEGILLPHYTPCKCKPRCGAGCPCVAKSICCEKFCGCSMNCNTRFRGCHCQKDQCSSESCPCHRAGRECDPDLCSFCWVSCGDGSWIPPNKVSDHTCQNMKLLLRQQQKVLLGRSDIAGWGAFAKNNVAEGDFIGEYTGEIISHYEADRRGKIYDRVNHSFLFNLNKEFVIDACRMGNKLKFANHSLEPNCQPGIKFVNGDHRMGIYALKDINAGDELLYNYQYDPDTCPAWAEGLMEPTYTMGKGKGKAKAKAGPSRKRATKHS